MELLHGEHQIKKSEVVAPGAELDVSLKPSVLCVTYIHLLIVWCQNVCLPVRFGEYFVI